MSLSRFPVPIFPASITTDEDKETLLEKFAVDWTTFINQIFGDENIRKIIMRTYKTKGIKLLTQDFEDPIHGSMNHHVTNLECSVDGNYQNTRVHREDMLCQSYSLMNYLGIPFDKRNASELWKDKPAAYNSRKGIQDTMIQMYRNILSNNAFLKRIKSFFTNYSKYLKPGETWVYPNVNDDADGYWVDFSTDELFAYKQFEPSGISKRTAKQIVKQTNRNFYDFIYSKIHEVLDAWENYGWLRFIGNGTYDQYLRNSTPKNAQRRTQTQSMSPPIVRQTRSISTRRPPENRRSTRRTQNNGR
jgi:hypothetical protein